MYLFIIISFFTFVGEDTWKTYRIVSNSDEYLRILLLPPAFQMMNGTWYIDCSWQLCVHTRSILYFVFALFLKSKQHCSRNSMHFSINQNHKKCNTSFSKVFGNGVFLNVYQASELLAQSKNNNCIIHRWVDVDNSIHTVGFLFRDFMFCEYHLYRMISNPSIPTTV